METCQAICMDDFILREARMPNPAYKYITGQDRRELKELIRAVLAAFKWKTTVHLPSSNHEQTAEEDLGCGAH